MIDTYFYDADEFGRKEILSSADEINETNLVPILTQALGVHGMNQQAIDYLYRYTKGEQPILGREKKFRRDICNNIVENHASEIAQFTSGYFMGEPVTYVRRGDKASASEAVARLNDYMFYEDKPSHDKDLATWMAICGVGYRMILPDKEFGVEPDSSPFELDIPDPRHTFVVYSTGFGHKRLMGVRNIYRQVGESFHSINCVYTPTHYYEVVDGVIDKSKTRQHSLGDIPIFEYRLNMTRMGSFEPAIPLLNAINTVLSNRIDSVEQYVQSFLKFKNCDVDDEVVRKINELGAIVLQSGEGKDADVDIVSQELNQQQTQTLVDYLYDQVLTICGLPTTTKGGTSTSDTGAAVFLRDGWSQCEARARDTEALFKRSEKQFLRLVLKILHDTDGMELSLADIECKFTRRQHDNLLTKTQSLLHMLEAGLAPEVAIATSGLFNDPMDVALQSKDYLKKWNYIEMTTEEDEHGESDEENEKSV